jgi:hypothetical protein
MDAVTASSESLVAKLRSTIFLVETALVMVREPGAKCCSMVEPLILDLLERTKRKGIVRYCMDGSKSSILSKSLRYLVSASKFPRRHAAFHLKTTNQPSEHDYTFNDTANRPETKIIHPTYPVSLCRVNQEARQKKRCGDKRLFCRSTV